MTTFFLCGLCVLCARYCEIRLRLRCARTFVVRCARPFMSSQSNTNFQLTTHRSACDKISEQFRGGSMKTNATRIIDADGHVRETDEEIIEYMSAGYRNRRDAMLYFPLTPHHGWHRSIPANDFRPSDFRVPDWREWVDKLDEGHFRIDRALSDPLHACRPDRQSDLRRRTVPRLQRLSATIVS